MTPTDQTVYGNKMGNCFAACVASILNLSIQEVPNFCGDNPEGLTWWLEFINWAEKRRHQVMYFNFEEGPVHWEDFGRVIPVNQYWIASGKSPRGDFLHSVVYKGYRKLKHDPHFSRKGIVGDPKDAVIIIPGVERKEKLD